VRDEERRRSDKRTKRKGCCTRVLAALPAERLLGLWFFGRELWTRNEVIEAVQLVYLTLILLRAPLLSPSLYPPATSSLKHGISIGSRVSEVNENHE
jgi:hypothetical protein